MSPLPENQEEDDEEASGDGDDDSFDEDMEALRRACMLTGTNPDDLVDPSSATADSPVPDAEGSSSDEDELQVLRKLRSRFSITDSFQPLSLKPLSTLPPALSDGEEDDLGTLRAIQNRFGAYDNGISLHIRIYVNLYMFYAGYARIFSYILTYFQNFERMYASNILNLFAFLSVNPWI